MKSTEYLGARATFALPDWFGERQGYTQRSAADPTLVRERNSAHDALWRLRGVKEVCNNSQGKWVAVEFECAPKLLPRAIRKFEGKLNRLLKRYKEAR